MGAMSLPELILAILALLLTPGPTNTLMLLAGAERGPSGALRLIPAEVAGYLLTVLPLAVFGASLLDSHPGLRGIVTFAAAVWVAVLAVRLWRGPGSGGLAGSVTARDVFVTTALNPKALIFGLALLPSQEGMALHLALFSGLVAAVGMVWVALGAGLPRLGVRQPPALSGLRRLASVWLAALSIVLMVRSSVA